MIKKNNSKPILIALVALAIVAVTALAYGYITLQLEKQRFNRLDTDLADLTDKVLERDSSIELSKSKYCIHDIKKFGGGILSCSIDVSFKAIDSNKIGKLEQTLTDTFINLTSTFSQKSGGQTVSLGPNDQIIYSYLDLRTGITCALSKSIVDEQSVDIFQIDVTLSCSKHVSKPLFNVVR